MCKNDGSMLFNVVNSKERDMHAIYATGRC